MLRDRGNRLRLLRPVLGLSALYAVVAAHRYVVGHDWSDPTRLILVDHLFACGLLGVLLLLAWGSGERLLTWWSLTFAVPGERAVFAIALGLIVLSYLTFAVAAVGVLYANVAVFLGCVVAVWVRAELGRLFAGCHTYIGTVRKNLTTLDVIPRMTLAAAGLCLLLVILVALLPPFMYDALMYHLDVPRIFVREHRFVVLPLTAQANFPLGIEMLYTICLLFGSEATAGLLHVAFAVLTGCALWSVARHRFGSDVAWIAVIGLMTCSDVLVWAPFANIDLALMLYEFLALVAMLRWQEQGTLPWLALGGVMAGMACASKYTGLTAVCILGCIVLGSARHPRAIRATVAGLGVFLLTALLVASPWYVKNVLLLHDPMYPVLSHPDLHPYLADPATLATTPPVARHGVWWLITLPVAYLSAGKEFELTGRDLADYLLLPITVYLRGDLEIVAQPSLFFLLAPFCVLCSRDRTVGMLAFFAVVSTVLWAIGPQELRYLLPTFPAWALLSAVGFARVAGAIPSAGRRHVYTVGVLAALLCLAVGQAFTFTQSRHPVGYFLGTESREAFLIHSATNYAAFQFLASVQQPGEQVLSLGEKRPYYAKTPILFDNATDQSIAAFVVPGSAAHSAAILERAHVRYILLSPHDLDWWGQFFPDVVRREHSAFEEFRATYLTLIYQSPDGATLIYRFTPHPQS